MKSVNNKKNDIKTKSNVAYLDKKKKEMNQKRWKAIKYCQKDLF